MLGLDSGAVVLLLVEGIRQLRQLLDGGVDLGVGGVVGRAEAPRPGAPAATAAVRVEAYGATAAAAAVGSDAEEVAGEGASARDGGGGVPGGRGGRADGRRVKALRRRNNSTLLVTNRAFFQLHLKEKISTRLKMFF